MRRIGVLITIFCIAAIVVALFAFDRAQSNSPSVRIGVLTPLTGDVASWGQMQRNATEMALNEVNSMGGLRGHPVKVIYEDSKANPRVGLNAFRKLVDVDRVPLVVGCPASNTTLAIAQYANESQTVVLSSGSTAQVVGEAGPYVFRIMPSDEVQAGIMADWAKSLGFNRVAIIYVENTWGRGLADAFESAFQQQGGVIVSKNATQQEATDFRAQLQRVFQTAPDAIYAPLYTRQAGLMIRQARELGLSQQILGADVYETPELMEAGGEAVEGVLYTTYSSGEGQNHDTFAATYRNEFGREPEAYAFYCYDAMKIAFYAIKQIPDSESITGSRIRDALLGIEQYDGVTGTTSFSGSNSAKGKTFVKWTIKDGKHSRID